MTTAAPYGSWPSPVTPELLVAGASVPGAVWADGGVVWWSESRPEEGGRIQIVRRDPGGERVDLLPDGVSARTRVHEYGGGAWWVHDGVVFFAGWADQRLYRLEPGGEPVPITPEPAEHHALRYADGRCTPDGRWIVCVRESHEAGEPAVVRNELVALPADGASAPAVLVTGRGLRGRSPHQPRRAPAGVAGVGPPGHAVGRHRAVGRPPPRRCCRASPRGAPAGGGRADRVAHPARVGAPRRPVRGVRPQRLVEPPPRGGSGEPASPSIPAPPRPPTRCGCSGSASTPWPATARSSSPTRRRAPRGWS